MENGMTNIPRGYFGGCLKRETRFGEGLFAAYGTDGTPPLFSRRQLEAMIPVNGSLVLRFQDHTINQRSQNSCCGCAGVGALMICENMEGDGGEILSQATPYAFEGVDANGRLVPRRRDDGMMIEQCLRVLQMAGACNIQTIGQYDWVGYQRKNGWPEDWADLAALHRVAEAWDCADEQAVMSAVACGYPVVYGSNGHAVVAVGFDKKGVIILNSWGSGWGDDGIGRWPTREIPSYGAWALRCTTADDAPSNNVDEGARRRWGVRRR
jgi:hypothetical protein